MPAFARSLLALLLAIASSSAAADDGPRQLQVHGFVDVAASFDANRPPDNGAFFPGAGTTGRRTDELFLNLAAIDLQIPPAPVGAHLTLAFGTGAEVVHAGETTGPATSPALWRFLEQASLSYRAGIGSGLLFEAGIYPSHMGLETFHSRDNWSYTRGYMGEFSPYYQAGIKGTYAFSDSFSAQLHVLNGFQLIGDNNLGKTLGFQLAWKLGQATATLNGLLGPELPGDSSHLRYLGDSILALPLTSRLELQATADVGAQELPGARTAVWTAGAFLARAQVGDAAWFSVRVEVFHDPDPGGISGTPQTLRDGSATFEIRPDPALSLKLEARYDRSTAAVFGGHGSLPNGGPERVRSQFLALAAAVASF